MSEKNKGGRPVVWTPELISSTKEKLEKYIDESDIPVLADFCTKEKVLRQRLYEIPELSDTIKLLTQKKEANLELGCLSNAINPTMAIFSLKQLGWKDRQEVENTNRQVDEDGKTITPSIIVRFVKHEPS